MKPNPVKQTLKSGGVSLGTMVFEFASTGIGAIAARAGAEYVLYDMEHTGWSMETIRNLIAATKAADIVPLVRVPATEYHFVARVLDIGARGVMVPMVESAEQAAAIVRFSKYPPMGRRGAAFGVAHDDYAIGNLVETIRTSNEEVLSIAQIETPKGLENADAIAATPGIDVLWMGLYDLTNFLGIPAQMNHPRVDEAIRTVMAAVNKHGKAAAILVGSVEEGKQRIAQGFRCIAYGGDIGLYQRALAQGLKSLREV